MDSAENFQVIEMHMLKKYMFFPLAGLGTFTVNTILYPISLIRTRLVMQHGNNLYTGMIHCARTILIKEGWKGLYNGFFVKSIQLFSGMAYVGTYETIRFKLADFDFNPHTRSFIAGGFASAVGQTLVVPVDVVSQHMMIINNKDTSVGSLSSIKLTNSELKTPLSRFIGVCSHIRHEYGIRGFYKGYAISMITFIPNSALWWGFYNLYCDKLSNSLSFLEIPRLLIQVVSAPLAGSSAALIMNPIDCIRMRIQVKNCKFLKTVSVLWREDRWFMFHKGLSARLTQSITYSFWIILFYEPIKYFCLKEDFKKTIKI
uniref:Slc25a-15 n=1 Tax=Schmidtea mediterranea TaxID=79327 RepID=A0A0H3YKB3_SCHMD|nr:slc25a-15 [Schmidtea mediterranea]